MDPRSTGDAMRVTEAAAPPRGAASSAASDHVAILDREGSIVAVNDAWARFARENGGRPQEVGIGVSYLDACRRAASRSDPTGRDALDGITAVLEGRSPGFLLEYPCSSPSMERWFSMSVTRLERPGDGVVVVHTDVTARVLADRTVRATEERLRAVIESQTELVCRWLPDTTLTFVNDAYCRYFGRSPEALLGTRFVTLVEDAARPDVEAHAARGIRCMTRSSPVTIGSHAVNHGSGGYRWLEWIDHGIFDAAGQLVEVQSVGRDVTDRKRVEAELRERDERLRRVLETTQAVPWEADARTWRFTYVGPQALKLLGYPLERWYQKDFWSEHLHPDDRVSTLEACARNSRREENFVLEYRMIGADGRVAWIQDLVSVVLEDGEPRVLRGFLVDATERREAQRALEERLGFEALLSDLSALFVTVPGGELDTHVREGLRRVADFFDVDRCSVGSIRQEGDLQITHTYARPDVPLPADLGPVSWYTSALHRGEAVVLSQLPDDLPTNALAERERVESAGMCSHVAVPVVVGGTFQGLINLSTFRAKRAWSPELIQRLRMVGETVGNALRRRQADETVQRQRDELSQLGRLAALGELGAAVAHELNQPLTAILANAQAARRFLARGLPSEDHEDVLRDIVGDATRAGEMIRRLRNLLQRRVVESSLIDLNAVVSEVEMLARADAGHRHTRLHVDLAPEPLPADGDPVQLQQVLLNLVRNGAEAMQGTLGSAGVLVVRTFAQGNHQVGVAVRDAGPPIGDEVLGRLFEPLYTTKPEGLGMGLAVARTIVEAHRGEISAARNADRGLTVQVLLPRRPETSTT